MMFENPATTPNKENENEALQKSIAAALDNLEHYKEMPDVELTPDEGGTYQSQDQNEVEQKRANKYRKVAFGTIANNLTLIMLQAGIENGLNQKLSTILNEISDAQRTTKDMIDRFDAIAYEIIEEGKKALNKE